MSVVGIVLAGGRSSRFGSEKAMTPWNDGIMIDAPIRVLAETCLETAISARPGSGAAAHAASLGLHCLFDDAIDSEGPLAGIRRGLTWADDRGAVWLAVAPCDAPTLTADHYRSLIRSATQTGTAVFALSPGGPEPLVSIWPVTAGLSTVRAALAAGAHPAIHAVLSTLNAVAVPLDDYDGVNVNRRADLPA